MKALQLTPVDVISNLSRDDDGRTQTRSSTGCRRRLNEGPSGTDAQYSHCIGQLGVQVALRGHVSSNDTSARDRTRVF